ncbi:hypothetical protein GCM10022409_44980 [Hymenobacter glaciei]|uniref:Uncharacterized protein n=1 Tax=Hymenobacter glaciei TaxID=877209 RepID=A0ABP7UU77_9BACT
MSFQSQTLETLYFQNAAGRLYYQPAAQVVRLACAPERIAVAAIQEYYEQVLALMLSTGSHKILSCHGQRAPILAAAQEWLTSNWIPRAIAQAGARYCAIVEGADPLHRLFTQSVVAASPNGLQFQRFAELGEAPKLARSGKRLVLNVSQLNCLLRWRPY